MSNFVGRAKVFSSEFSSDVFFMRSDGCVYAYGRNSHGSFGLGDKNERLQPTKLDFFDGYSRRIKQIACGTNFTIFLTSNGDVYSCGSNFYGQLGLKDNMERLVPELVITLMSMEVVWIACGDYASFCVTVDGKIYGFGNFQRMSNNSGKQALIRTPTRIKTANDIPVVSLSVGSNCLAILLRNGTIYEKLQFGINFIQANCESTFRSHIMKQNGHRMPEEVPVQVISCGGKNIVMYSKSSFLAFDGLSGSPISQKTKVDNIDFNYEENPIENVAICFNTVMLFLKSKEIIFGSSELLRYLGNKSYRGNFYDNFTKLEHKIEDSRVVDAVPTASGGIFISENGNCHLLSRKSNPHRYNGTNQEFEVEKLFENVQLGENIEQYAPRFLSDDLIKFALGEQKKGQQSITDVVISIKNVEKVLKTDIYLNRRLMEILFDLDFLADESGGYSIITRSIFNLVLKEQFIRHLYGGEVDFDKLKVEDIAILHDVLNRYGISEMLKSKCEIVLRNSMDTKKAAVRVYVEADKLHDESIVRISLIYLKRDTSEYLKEILKLEGAYGRELLEKISSMEICKVPPPNPHTSVRYFAMETLFDKISESGDLIVQGNGSGVYQEEFKAHKFVLAARKLHFRKKLQDMPKKGRKSDKMVLDMPLDESFRVYLRYLYTENTKFTFTESLKILNYLKHFGEDGPSDRLLKDICEQRIRKMCVMNENYVDIYRIGVELGIDNLSKAALDFITENFDDLREKVMELSFEMDLRNERRSHAETRRKLRDSEKLCKNKDNELSKQVAMCKSLDEQLIIELEKCKKAMLMLERMQKSNDILKAKLASERLEKNRLQNKVKNEITPKKRSTEELARIKKNLVGWQKNSENLKNDLQKSNDTLKSLQREHEIRKKECTNSMRGLKERCGVLEKRVKVEEYRQEVARRKLELLSHLYDF